MSGIEGRQRRMTGDSRVVLSLPLRRLMEAGFILTVLVH